MRCKHTCLASLVIFLSFSWLFPVSAQQNPNIPNLPVNPAERQIERQIERVTRQVARMERAPAETIQQRAIDSVLNASERASERALNGTLMNGLPELPPRLSITNQLGVERFVEVEVEPGRRAIEREWVLLVTEQEIEELQNVATELWTYLSEKSELGGLQQVMLLFTVPRHLDNPAGMMRLLPTHFHAALDRNYVYQANSASSLTAEHAATVGRASLLPLATQLPAICHAPVRIGVVDTALEYTHSGFARAREQQRLVRRSFLAADLKQPSAHGTAVTSLLVGEYDVFLGLTPQATVYHAEVFYQQSDSHQGAPLSSVLQALNWQVEQQVQVINLSLTGPHNRILEETVRAISRRNISIVAAAGNAGPFAEPLFPAAYEEVIAVTAVDANGEVYRWANQGEYIEFAAYGVGVQSAQLNSTWGPESGTSIAAPIVTAFAACNQQSTPNETRAVLQRLAIDLGEEGRDQQYGHGLLHPF